MDLFKVNTAQSENAWWAMAASVIASVSAACGLTTINVTVNNMLPQDIKNAIKDGGVAPRCSFAGTTLNLYNT